MSAHNINIEELLKELDPRETLHPAVKKIAKWKEVHNALLKQPFCQKRQRLVRIIICLDYEDCRWEGFCFPCFEQGIKHELSYTPPIEFTPLVKICSDTYDWHDVYKETKSEYPDIKKFYNRLKYL